MSYVKYKPHAWSTQWLREMSWRELREIHRAVVKHGIPLGVMGSRLRRAEAEWERRKKEGGGGCLETLERTGHL